MNEIFARNIQINASIDFKFPEVQGKCYQNQISFDFSITINKAFINNAITIMLFWLRTNVRIHGSKPL